MDVLRCCWGKVKGSVRVNKEVRMVSKCMFNVCSSDSFRGSSSFSSVWIPSTLLPWLLFVIDSLVKT